MELMHEATEAPYQFDDGWIVRFMERLQQEDPKLTAVVKKAVDKTLKELDDKTIRQNNNHRL